MLIDGQTLKFLLTHAPPMILHLEQGQMLAATCILPNLLNPDSPPIVPDHEKAGGYEFKGGFEMTLLLLRVPT